MKGPTCPACKTESSIERGDALILTKTLSLVLDDFLDHGLSYIRDEANDVLIILRECHFCWRMRAGVDEPHHVVVTTWDNETTHNLKDKASADIRFETCVKEATNPGKPDAHVKMYNLLREVVREEFVDNGNPNYQVWTSKYGPLSVMILTGTQKDVYEYRTEVEAEEGFQKWVKGISRGAFPYYGSLSRDVGKVTVTLRGRDLEPLKSVTFEHTKEGWEDLRKKHSYVISVCKGSGEVLSPYYTTNPFIWSPGETCERYDETVRHAQGKAERFGGVETVILKHKASGKVILSTVCSDNHNLRERRR